MLSYAQLYNTHRSMLIRDTELFLSSVVRRMDWSREDQDVVMDVGCGPGDYLPRMLLPAFPGVRRVIAFDILPDMIEFARANHSHEKIEYHVADIEERQTLEIWADRISKVVSSYCFHWLGNQRGAFANIFHVLRHGGEAAFVFVLRSPIWDSFPSLMANTKWSKFLKGVNPHIPESYFKMLGPSYYRIMLQDIGFKVVVCEDEEKKYSYPNDDDCRDAVFAVCALGNHIPDELKDEFKEDLFRGFLKHNGRGPDGRPLFFLTTLTLLIQKPEA